MTTDSFDSIWDLLYTQTAQSKYGGYKLSLLKDPLPSLASSFLLCSKCKSVLRQACSEMVQGHFVCEECSDSEHLIPAVPSRAAISELAVLCPLAPRGCPWGGFIVGLEVHLASCAYFKIECTNGCGTILMRLELEAHKCELGQVECECGAKINRKEMNEHASCCQEILVNCDQCGLGIRRKFMDAHVKDQCPESILACEYSKYGCGVNIKRREMELHLDKFKLAHFEMHILGLESKMLMQEMIIGDMQEREIEKEGVITELKLFKDQMMRRVLTLEGNASIKPCCVEFQILDLRNSFENTLNNITREICVVSTFGYYEIEFSYSFLCVDMLSIFIQIRCGERDAELEWPLKACCNVSLLPCKEDSADKVEYIYPPVDIVQNNPFDIHNEISLIASIDKATALDPGYCQNETIWVSIKLQSTAPLVKLN